METLSVLQKTKEKPDWRTLNWLVPEKKLNSSSILTFLCLFWGWVTLYCCCCFLACFFWFWIAFLFPTLAIKWLYVENLPTFYRWWNQDTERLCEAIFIAKNLNLAAARLLCCSVSHFSHLSHLEEAQCTSEGGPKAKNTSPYRIYHGVTVSP